MENRTNSNISHQIPARVIEADSSLARDIRLKRLRMIDTLVARIGSMSACCCGR
jgi:hypothetical protein